jgi:hypothetical protein
MQKTTNKDLVLELSKLDQMGELRPIIINAIKNKYHCFKSEVAAPKHELVKDLNDAINKFKHPGLNQIKQAVINGVYDERPDQQDIKDMSAWLQEENAPDILYDILGLIKPEPNV